MLIELLPRLWVPAGPPFRPLADEAAWWRSYLPERWEQAGRPFERRLLDAALDALAHAAAPRRASRCWSTRTCTATTCSPRSASRGW